MAKKIGSQTSWAGGLSDGKKSGGEFTYAYGRSVNHRLDPRGLTINPKTIKDSGSSILNLPLWGTRACNRIFFYDEVGNIYIKESGAYTKVHTAADSQGNGISYYTEDRNLYYAQDTTIGKLQEACTGDEFFDGFLESEGGEPTNTKSLNLNGTDQYASRADTASTSVTLDLSLEAYIKPTTLPVDLEEQVLVSKWDEDGDQRSYRMYVTTKSDVFNDGSDGDLTISTNTTESPIDSACSGTIDTYALTATNASFAAGQVIVIVQMRGTNAGVVQQTTIQSYTAGTITTTDKLAITYSSTGSNKAQVIVKEKYATITINNGITYSCKAWNGSTGGFLTHFASVGVINNGTINLNGKGFVGGISITGVIENPSAGFGWSGEGDLGASIRQTDVYTSSSSVQSHNGSGGGGGAAEVGSSIGGGGGGHATSGGNSMGGDAVGTTDLTTIFLGGAGGGGGASRNNPSGKGGNSGGIAWFTALDYDSSSGKITLDGNNGDNGSYNGGAPGGGGSGGSFLLDCQTADMGTTSTAIGGTKGAQTTNTATAGNGSVGRINVNYLTSVTGTTTPTYNSIQDNTLASGDGYSLKLQVSDDGAASETYSWDITERISTSTWIRPQIRWDASLSTAIAYINGVALDTRTGSMTSIYDSTAGIAVGCDFNSTAQNFYNGLIDDVRVWNDIRTQSEFSAYNDIKLTGYEANLMAYYQMESNVEDAQQSGLNDLTATGTPTYSDDVPFKGVTARNDDDQSNTNTGQTYSVPAAISEASTDRQSFVPDKDPQKSVEISIATKGTGDWTITAHDPQNREVATATIFNADLADSNIFEFTWDNSWRPVIGATYHFHVTSTVADGTLVTGTTTDLEDGYFKTHYQILVDSKYHPMKQMLNFMAIGNERYIAKLEGGPVYDPNFITLPADHVIRCFGYWREYIVAGTYRGTDINDYQEGFLFFWDGISETYNHWISVPEGGVNAIFGTRDILYVVAGTEGDILAYTGQGSAQKLDKIPGLEEGDNVEIAPGAINMWNTLVCFGTSYSCNADNVHKGILTVGTKTRDYPQSFAFDFPLSLGDQISNNVKIGMLFPAGQDLYIGWQNNNAYGIDILNLDNDCYQTATLEQLIVDANQISKEKLPLIIRADFEPLVSGQRIKVKYKLDRSDIWVESEWEDTVGATEIRYSIDNRAKELQPAVDLESTTGVSPKLLGLSIEVDDPNAISI